MTAARLHDSHAEGRLPVNTDYSNLRGILLAFTGFTFWVFADSSIKLLGHSNLPVYEVRTMEQILDEDTSQRKFQSFVMSVFAGLAVVLASIGLFGVLTSLVGQRTQEIGIRMALGAQSKDVLRMVVGEGVRLVLLGVVIGVGAGVALSRYLASLFFGVSPANPTTYLEVAALMITIALIACLLPALRAIRVNPMTALRYE